MSKGINCIIRLGLPGSGKTLDQTEVDVLPHLIAGEQVYSCYWINWNGDNLHYFSEFEEVENLRNAIVVFDEIGQILPARQWAEEGLRVQMFFQLHRHRHIDIIGNTQDVSLVAKTVGIVANKWLYCEKKNNKATDLILNKVFDYPIVMMSKTPLSYQALKKMANGWELEGVMKNQANTGIEKVLNKFTKQKFYPVKKILHKDLDKYKIELVHKYCPKCAMRQGSEIPKDDTLNICNFSKGIYTLKKPEFCPKHTNQALSVRLSGMYDTDHEPIIKEKKITLQAMIDSPAGYRKIPYKGALSERQAKFKEEESKKYF